MDGMRNSISRRNGIIIAFNVQIQLLGCTRLDCGIQGTSV